MNAISRQIFQKTRVVWSRQHVHVNGAYTTPYGFLKVIRACKMLDIPVIVVGSHTDRYQQCFDEGWGAILKSQSKTMLNELYNLSKIYVCIVSHVSLGMMEAMKCGCYILCSSRNEMADHFTKDGFWVYDHDNQQDFEEKLWDDYHQPRMTQHYTSWWDVDWSAKIYL